MRKILCIYHGNCADGFGAAWVIRKAFGEDNIDFVAGIYGEPPPDVTGRSVIIVDYSYKRPVLLKMAEIANKILIIDHHKSAQEDLVDLPPIVRCKFDMNHSGAMLTWNYFFPDREPLPLLEHIQDRDLWRFKLLGTREIQANLFSYPYDFEVWDALMEQPIETLIKDGIAIERKHQKDVNELISKTVRRMTIGGYLVPVANLPYTLASDAGHLLSGGEPFAACYYDSPEGRRFSLRSQPEGIDVSKVAVAYGGGGHAHAAGFTMPIGWEGEQ